MNMYLQIWDAAAKNWNVLRTQFYQEDNGKMDDFHEKVLRYLKDQKQGWLGSHFRDRVMRIVKVDARNVETVVG